MTRLLVLIALVVSSFALGDSPAHGETRPNILIVTADNLGYGDLRSFNPQSRILSPNLDRLAREGARLTNFYTASPTCTVSRACLLTGRVADRHGLKIQLPGLEGNYGLGLSHDEVLIPQILRPLGYATGCFGKWNIGFAPGSRPTERGFDQFFGHASGNIDYETHVYNGQHDLFRGIEPAYVTGYSSDLFADAAIAFIEQQRRQPWFVYLPFNAPHFPNRRNKASGVPTVWQAPDTAFAAYDVDPATTDERQRYRAVVTAMDAALGRVLDALDRLELTRNTFVFFFADNGAFMLRGRGLEVATNAPLRDGGVTCWEGGVRVAAIARWPSQIAAGATIDTVLWSPDLLPACASMADAPLPKGQVLDGRNPLPALTEQAPSPHASLYFTFGSHAALRQGDWKIVRTQPQEAWQLFNLHDDLGETTDLAATRPDQRDRLVDLFEHWLR